MGTLAVALAAINVFGGFLVTQRMLEMFKKKNRKQPKMMRRRPNNEYEFGDDAVSDCIGMFYSGF